MGHANIETTLDIYALEGKTIPQKRLAVYINDAAL